MPNSFERPSKMTSFGVSKVEDIEAFGKRHFVTETRMTNQSEWVEERKVP